ncbi:MAG TPA: nucleotidyltransferase family protein [Candidatus Acidoferrales bacterium]|nr:nucleotidyltransferase family protein [Candidatus Acidoferrales bacterium]
MLAGGQGERLRPIVTGIPKALAPVGGRPFLAWLLDRLAEAGVENVVLCTGYLAPQVEQAFGPRYRSLSLAYSPEPRPLDTGGALRLALDRLRGDPLLVLNGDSFCELDFAAMLDSHRRKRAHATIAVVHRDDAARFGAVSLAADGRVVRFNEKAAQGAGWINAGVYLLARQILESLPAGAKISLERDVFPSLAAQGLLYAYPGVQRFLDIGTPESYRQAERLAEHWSQPK